MWAEESNMASLITIKGNLYVDTGQGYLVYVERANVFHTRDEDSQIRTLLLAGAWIAEPKTSTVH